LIWVDARLTVRSNDDVLFLAYSPQFQKSDLTVAQFPYGVSMQSMTSELL